MPGKDYTVNIRTAVEDYGASTEKKKTSVASVSFWYIPGGYDYVNAQAVRVYFDDMEKAKKFEKDYDSIPEMAFLTELTDKEA